jgi:hypothetical protein
MLPLPADIRAQLYQALKSAFPDSQVTDADVMALAVHIDRESQKGAASLPQSLRRIDLSSVKDGLRSISATLPDGNAQPRNAVLTPGLRYYWADATHARVTPSGFDPFVGRLGMVRVTLPQSSPATFHTAFGDVTPGDHLIDTVYEVNQKFQKSLGYPLARVDLITPAREGVRFGAISVALGYKAGSDRLPSCYILEAGTATGQPKVLYLGKRLGEPINAYSGYQPTPFACPSHAYLGTFSVKPGTDEPDRLDISARAIQGGVSQSPYIKVSIQWSLQTGTLENIWPGFLLAKASAIVLERLATHKISTDCQGQGAPA